MINYKWPVGKNKMFQLKISWPRPHKISLTALKRLYVYDKLRML